VDALKTEERMIKSNRFVKCEVFANF